MQDMEDPGNAMARAERAKGNKKAKLGSDNEALKVMDPDMDMSDMDMDGMDMGGMDMDGMDMGGMDMGGMDMKDMGM